MTVQFFFVLTTQSLCLYPGFKANVKSHLQGTLFIHRSIFVRIQGTAWKHMLETYSPDGFLCFFSPFPGKAPQLTHYVFGTSNVEKLASILPALNWL